MALGQGTNTVARLQFGKSPTNDTRLVYARRLGLNAIVAVRKDLLAPWYAQVNDFRDPFLVTWTAPVAVIDVRGQDSFSLQQTNDDWRVLPQDFPADAGLVRDLVSGVACAADRGVHQRCCDRGRNCRLTAWPHRRGSTS